MACRKINKRYADEGYVIKEIEWDNSFTNKSNLKFPYYNHPYQEELNKIFDEINLNKIARQAITQQYNEIYIYNEANAKEKNILAPQVKIYPSYFNLPSIMYPKFYPLIKEEEVWNLNEDDMFVCLGTKLQWFGISYTQYKDFINRVKDLCENFSLCADDILKNPSNIGYHTVLGLRIIDYGLLEN